MAKLNNVEIHFKHSNRTYNTMTAFLVMLSQRYRGCAAVLHKATCDGHGTDEL